MQSSCVFVRNRADLHKRCPEWDLNPTLQLGLTSDNGPVTCDDTHSGRRLWWGRVLGQFVYSFRPDGSGTRFTLEHVPGAIGKIPVIGALFERLWGRRAAGFLDDLRRHLESLTDV